MAGYRMLARACDPVEMGSVNTLAEPTPFEPPLSLSRGVVSWLNEIAAPRMVLESRLGDKPLSMRMNRLVWQADPSGTSMLDCVFRVGGEMAVLSLPRPLAETLISTVQHDLTLPSDPTRSLLLELLLEPWLARLENLLARDLQLVRIDEATTQGPYLQLDIAYGPLTGKARLFLFSSLDGPVPSAFGALGALINQLPREMRKLSPELPVMVAREIGSLRVSVALLRQAQTGDALLPDVVPYARGQVILTADKLWASALVDGDRLILQGRSACSPIL